MGLLCDWLPHREPVVKVSLRPRKEQDVLMRVNWSPSRRFGNPVRLRPDDRLPDPPPVVLEPDGEAERDEGEVLALEITLGAGCAWCYQ